MTARRPLVCCAQPFGFGPAAKAILLATALRDRGVSTVFVGRGIAHELAARSPAFDDVIDANPTDPRAVTVVDGSSGVLSVMDRDFAELGLRRSRPVVVADSLAWLRDRVPAPFVAANRYWCQRFAGPSVGVPVGPIVPVDVPTPSGERRGLLVNLGGGESPHGSLTDLPGYFEFVIRGLTESGLPDEYAAVTVIGGVRCTDALRRQYPGEGITFEPVSHEAAVTAMANAAAVLTAPGLTTILECFRLGVPTGFLPPQNYSQWRILDELRRAGAAPNAFHWRDREPGFDAARLPEATRTPTIRARIGHWITAEAALRFRASLREGLADPAGTTARQCRFLTGLGGNGVDEIVADLTRTLGEACDR